MPDAGAVVKTVRRGGTFWSTCCRPRSRQSSTGPGVPAPGAPSARACSPAYATSRTARPSPRASGQGPIRACTSARHRCRNRRPDRFQTRRRPGGTEGHPRRRPGQRDEAPHPGTGDGRCLPSPYSLGQPAPPPVSSLPSADHATPHPLFRLWPGQGAFCRVRRQPRRAVPGGHTTSTASPAARASSTTSAVPPPLPEGRVPSHTATSRSARARSVRLAAS